MKKLIYFLFFMASTACATMRLPDYVKSLESLPADSGLLSEFRNKEKQTPIVEDKTCWQKASEAANSPEPKTQETKSKEIKAKEPLKSVNMEELLSLMLTYSKEISAIRKVLAEMKSDINGEDLKKISDKLNIIISSLENNSQTEKTNVGFFSKVGSKIDTWVCK